MCWNTSVTTVATAGATIAAVSRRADGRTRRHVVGLVEQQDVQKQEAAVSSQ